MTAEEIEKLVRRREQPRPQRDGSPSGCGLLGLLAGGAYAAWRWWDKQANPDWLVEPPAATEVGDRGPLSSVGGSGRADRGPATGWTRRSRPRPRKPEAKEAEAKAKAKRRGH